MTEDPIYPVCSRPIVPGGAVAFRPDGVVHLACWPPATSKLSAEPLPGEAQAADLVDTVLRAVRPRGLVIDDEPGVRAFVYDAVDSLGYEVDAAEDGAKGLALFDQRRYDLIVTDLRMPHMSGWEVVEAVSRRGPMPIVIMAGFITSADEERARDGGIALLRKPFGIAERL